MANHILTLNQNVLGEVYYAENLKALKKRINKISFFPQRESANINDSPQLYIIFLRFMWFDRGKNNYFDSFDYSNQKKNPF